MSFLNPEALYFLLPPLFILFTLLLTQKEAQGNFFSDEMMEKLRVSANTLTMKARDVLFFLMAILMVIALAQPVIKDGTIVVKAKSADIMIALDISDSMLAEDTYPNRLKFAKEKAMGLLKFAPNERVGVVAFAKNSYLVSPMSFDHNAVGFLLRQLSTNSITEKGTDFLSLLNVVDSSINKESKKYLLVLSDGGDKSDFSDEIEYAKEKNIVVFILGIGTKKGTPIKLSDGSFIKQNGEIIISKLNENISNLATKTGGVYIESIKSDTDIKTMLKEIEANSEQKELKSEEVQKYIPLFYYPVIIALTLLLIATSSMWHKQKILPILIVFISIFVTPHAKAGVLDFMELKEAKKAYESGDFEKSAKLYSKHAKTSQNGASYFNGANALYKQGKFSEAIKLYQKATFNNKLSQANKLANLGNAHAKDGKPQSLQKAIESYEKSLKLHEDKDVRENLEAVKKEMKKQKQKKKKQDKKKKQKQKKQEKDKKQEKKNGQDKKEKKEKNGNKKQDKKKNSKKEQQKKQKKKTDKMSDAEEKKWLNQLNKKQSTFMYRLNDSKPQKRGADEKPW